MIPVVMDQAKEKARDRWNIRRSLAFSFAD